MARKSEPLLLSQQDIAALEKMASCPDGNLRIRARIILAYGQNPEVQGLADKLGISKETVTKWRNRYRKEGIKGLQRYKKLRASG